MYFSCFIFEFLNVNPGVNGTPANPAHNLCSPMAWEKERSMRRRMSSLAATKFANKPGSTLFDFALSIGISGATAASTAW